LCEPGSTDPPRVLEKNLATTSLPYGEDMWAKD
jgi:hypothetical protein